MKLIGLSQETYIDKVFLQVQYEEIQDEISYMNNDIHLNKAYVRIQAEKEKMIRFPYNLVIGSIMYVVTCTQSEDPYAISMCSKYHDYFLVFGVKNS